MSENIEHKLTYQHDCILHWWLRKPSGITHFFRFILWVIALRMFNTVQVAERGILQWLEVRTGSLVTHSNSHVHVFKSQILKWVNSLLPKRSTISQCSCLWKERTAIRSAKQLINFNQVKEFIFEIFEKVICC